jgi:two-component system, LytTR family, response regulator
MTKTRIIIVDDNEDSLDILQFYISQLPNFEIVDNCRNGEELIDSLLKTDPDVVLLDINMPKMNGMKAIQECLKIKNNLLFVFVTSYDEYAVKAFELSAVDYIVKPVEKTRLYAALEKVMKELRTSNFHQDGTFNSLPQRLVIKEGNHYYYIPAQEILFIEKIGKKCHICTMEREYVVSSNLGELMAHLPTDSFFMSHRSYIINLNKLSSVSSVNQTYVAYFTSTDKYAHISKLKIDELQSRIISKVHDMRI